MTQPDTRSIFNFISAETFSTLRHRFRASRHFAPSKGNFFESNAYRHSTDLLNHGSRAHRAYRRTKGAISMKLRNLFAAPIVAISLLATPVVNAAAINS